MKKMNNKGFSLVELIVVIAIMGVLMVVLAPQYLKYVEKSRLQKDNSAIAEIANNIKIACADETIANSITTSDTFTANHPANSNQTFSFSDSSGDLLEEEIASVIGTSFTTSSNSYKAATNALAITVVNEGGIYKVYVDNMIESVGGDESASRAF